MSREAFKTALIEFIAGPLSVRRLGARHEIQIDGSTRLFETGIIDSLAILDLLLFVEDVTGTPIPIHKVDMKFFGTVDRICNSFWQQTEAPL
jgi:acyl carrier protein